MKEEIVLQSESGAHANAEQDKGLLSPDLNMFLLTLFTFFALLAVLYKFAWKPILNALDQREESIRKSLEEAKHIQEELAKIDGKRKQMLAEAEMQAKDILAQSRRGATEASRIIHEKAKEEAHILLENIRREIKEETEKAQAVLRKESASIAVTLASKLIEKNLDEEENRKLIDQFIREL